MAGLAQAARDGVRRLHAYPSMAEPENGRDPIHGLELFDAIRNARPVLKLKTGPGARSSRPIPKQLHFRLPGFTPSALRNAR